jgi:small-conductance mechanosensitive channel
MRITGIGTVLLAAFVSVLPFACGWAQDAPPAAPHEGEIPTAQVRFDDRTLFKVRGVSSLPAAERAAAIAARITAVARDPALSPDAIVVAPVAVGVEIRAGDATLVSLVPADASLESVRLDVLAEAHRQRIRQAITQYRAEREPARLLRGIAFGLLATGVFAALVLVVAWLFRKAVAVLERRVRAHVEALPRGAFHFVQGKQLWEAMTSTVRGARWILILVLLYLWLQFVLSQFPWTRSLSEKLLTLLIDPLARMAEGLVDFVPNLLFLIVLALVTRYSLRLIKVYFSALEHGRATLANFEPEWALPAYKIVRTLAVALAVVMAYPYLPGTGTDALKGISVFAGLMLSLGASGAVSNVIAGYLNTFGRVFRVGDLIQVGEVRGEVTQVRLLTTRVRTWKNEEVTIPNATLITTHVVNYSALAQSQGLILHTEVGIGYEVPWRQVHAMLEEAARRTPDILREPPPFILQKRLADFAVVYELNVFSGTAKALARTYTRLHQNVLDVFNEHGVQIMTPAYEGDPDTPKVVPQDKWYAPPAKPPAGPG